MRANLNRRSFLALTALLTRLRAQTPESVAAALAKWQSIADLLGPDFKGTSPAASRSTPVRAGTGLEVRNITYTQTTLRDRTAFIAEWRTWWSAFSEVLTADFQVVAAEGSHTRVRYEIVGTGKGFHREQRVGYWRLEWSGASLTSWQWERETRSRSAHPWFTDITEQSFGPLPELRGTDHWRTVLDAASGIDIYGHNGVAAGDIDNSGFDSVYICQPAGLPNRLYRNRGDGTFEDISAPSGVDLLDNTACALFADFDNDGRQDLLVVRATGPLLFLNQGNGRFRLKPGAFRFAQAPQGTFMGASAADYDNDGWLDIYFCLYTFYQGAGQYNYPTPYFAAENGPPNFLMRSNRDGTFRDATKEAGLDVNNTRFSFCCAWGDLSGGGHPDLYVANDFGRKNLYRNNGDGTFTDIAPQAHAEDTGAGMSACWFDFDNDGRQDLYVANMWSAAGERITAEPTFQRDAPDAIRRLYRKHAMGNSLLRNRGDGTFEDRTAFDAGGMGRWAWSSDSWDFDHDGWPDLYIANGMISGPAREDLNGFFWREVVANSPAEARPSPEYERGWSAINDRIRSDQTWSGYERNVFCANNRDGTFSDVSGAVGLDFTEDGRAFALADFDHDGRVELLLRSRNAPELRLLKNVVPELPPSVVFRLRAVKGHPDAIGASVTVGRQTKYIQAGSGFLSQHSKELHFGLFDTKAPLTATIRWPGGAAQTLRDLPINHRISVEEGNGHPQVEPFAAARAVVPSKPRAAEPLPETVGTWLLVPVPAPGAKPGPARIVQDDSEVYKLLFRHLFDRRRDMPPQTSFLLNEQAEIVKVYQGPVTDAKDIAGIPRTSEERMALALPFKGNADSYLYGRNHLSLGSVFFARGFYEPAETFFRLALRDDPASAEAHYGIGSVLLKRNDLAAARASFERTVQLTASYSDTGPNAWNNLGLIATRERQIEEAIRCFREALKLSPDYWISLENLGNAYRQAGRTEEARATLERAVALRPRDASAVYSLAMTFAQRNDSARAEQLLKRALELKPEYPEARNNLGILYLRTQRRDAAVEQFETSIRLAPAFDQAYLNLARVFALEGAKDRARAILDDLLKRYPDHADARRLREEIK